MSVLQRFRFLSFSVDSREVGGDFFVTLVMAGEMVYQGIGKFDMGQRCNAYPLLNKLPCILHVSLSIFEDET